MKIENAFFLLRQGERVRRQSWNKNKDMGIEDLEGATCLITYYYFANQSSAACVTSLSSDDLLGDDWEASRLAMPDRDKMTRIGSAY